jgi:hypothetical protein
MPAVVERSKLVTVAQGRPWIRHTDLKERERAMAIGPVKRESDTVRVIDALAAGRKNGHA